MQKMKTTRSDVSFGIRGKKLRIEEVSVGSLK